MSNYQFVIPKTARVAQGTKKYFMTIQQREIAITNPNNLDVGEKFTIVYTMMGSIEQLKPSERFSGVGTRREEVTAVIYVAYDPVIFQFDKESCFVNVEYNYFTGDINRWYKLIEIENLKEDSRELKIYCSETGFISKVAAGV